MAGMMEYGSSAALRADQTASSMAVLKAAKKDATLVKQ